MQIAETDRLVIRSPHGDDLDDLCAIYGDPVVAEYLEMDNASRPRIEKLLNESINEWQAKSRGLLMLALRDTGRVIGLAHVQPSPMEPPRDVEIVYAIHRDQRRRKFAKEAVSAIINQQFAAGVERIVARIKPGNEGSRKLLVSLGFTRGEDRVLKCGGAPEIQEHVYEKARSGSDLPRICD
jgi:RimJ/RimL family protein N-acetyltransferase